MRAAFRGAVFVVGALAVVASSPVEQSTRCDGDVAVTRETFGDDTDVTDRRDCAVQQQKCVEVGDDLADCRDFTAAEGCAGLFGCGFILVKNGVRFETEEACADALGADVAADPTFACAVGCLAQKVDCEEATVDACFIKRCDPPEEPSGGDGGGGGCCRVCTTGKACGDSCIDVSSDCEVGGGCACNG